MPQVFMPRLSDTMTEGTVSTWTKGVGDRIEKGDVIAEIETDKATMELEAYDAGVLEQILVDVGKTVPIGEVIAVIGDGSGAAAPAAADDAGSDDERSSVPAWFAALVHPEKTAVNVPISIHGQPGFLVITSHPDDEMNEIWDGIVTQLLVGSAIAVTLFLITMLVVSRALAPIQSLSQAMTDIEAGDGYAVEHSDPLDELRRLRSALLRALLAWLSVVALLVIGGWAG